VRLMGMVQAGHRPPTTCCWYCDDGKGPTRLGTSKIQSKFEDGLGFCAKNPVVVATYYIVLKSVMLCHANPISDTAIL